MEHSLQNMLAGLPPPWTGDALAEICQHLSACEAKVVILDDDPTGTQTVANISVVTCWDAATLADAFAEEAPGFFIMTNSRSLPERESKSLHREICAGLKSAADGRTFVIISRSDSTLRGHFPAETNVIQDELGSAELVVLAPFFEAGGRLTINDVHYVAEGDRLLPVAETPFAKDPDFGYRNSLLSAWIEEKSRGAVVAASVGSVGLDILRTVGPDGVEVALCQMLGSVSHVVVNAVTQSDMEVFIAGALRQERQGHRLLYRSGAALVSARLGLRPPVPLTPTEIQKPQSSLGGLIVVGSYVPQTTHQLECLLELEQLTPVKIDVQALLEATDRADFLRPLEAHLAGELADGRDVVLYTSRRVIERGTREIDHLAVGKVVSSALVSLVKSLPAAPRFIIAKGGITSSDIATQALGIRKAKVRGQLIPGVPVWSAGQGSRFPGLDYVIFPGNVGGNDALVQAYRKIAAPSE